MRPAASSRRRLFHLCLLTNLFLCVRTEAASGHLGESVSSSLYYGVYVGGQKVGTMHSSREDGKKSRRELVLKAEVRAMGRLATIALCEARQYDGRGRLIALDFLQKADTGEVKVTARRRDGQRFLLSVTAGGKTQATTAIITETLKDELALEQLAQTGQVNQQAQATHFDPSLQKNNRIVYTVVERQDRNIDGVSTPCVKVVARYPDLEIEESFWLDQKGRLLESRMGGYFVARLEPKEVAEQRDVQSDLLIGASVKAPRPLVRPQELERLTLTLAGLKIAQLPKEPWQRVRQVSASSDSQVEVLMSRVAAPKEPVLLGGPAPQLPAARQALLPTAFIQSDAPVLRAAAQRAIRGQTDVMGASRALVSFVGSHLKSEYVPAYSNALEAYTSRRGDCTEHSVLFAALARAVGIPARVVVGIAYWPPSEGYGWHAWNEIYLHDRWMPVDPTWSQPIADVTHLKLAEGDPAAQARVIMLLGSLRIDAQSAE